MQVLSPLPLSHFLICRFVFSSFANKFISNTAMSGIPSRNDIGTQHYVCMYVKRCFEEYSTLVSVEKQKKRKQTLLEVLRETIIVY